MSAHKCKILSTRRQPSSRQRMSVFQRKPLKSRVMDRCAAYRSPQEKRKSSRVNFSSGSKSEQRKVRICGNRLSLFKEMVQSLDNGAKSSSRERCVVFLDALCVYIYIYTHTFHFPSSFTAELARRWTRYSKLRRTVSVPTWRLFHLHRVAYVMAVRRPEINRNCLAVVKVDPSVVKISKL